MSPKITPEFITQKQVFKTIYETYESHDGISHRDWWKFNYWLQTPTGWLPLHIVEGVTTILWDVVLLHGRTYVMHFEEFLQPTKKTRQAARESKLKLVGMGHPW